VADALVLIGLALVLRAPTIGISVIDWDESNFTLVAREILRGHWPYTTVFEHKPVALFLHYAGALALFGDDPLAVRLLGITVAATSAIAVRAIATRCLGLSRSWGLFLGACYVVITIGFDGQAVFSEHIVNLYLLLCALLLQGPRRSAILLGGCAAGIALNVNYLALPVLCGMMAGHFAGQYLDRRLNPRRALTLVLLLASGAALATALLLLPIALSAGLGQYFGPQLRFLSGYAAVMSPAVRIVSAASLAAPLLPLAGVAAVLALLRPRLGDEGARPAASAYHPCLFAGAAAGSAIAVLASGYMFTHYMLLTAPWVLLLVASLAEPAGWEARLLSGATLAGSSLMIGLPGMFAAGVGAHNLLIEARTGVIRDEPRRLARLARPMVPPGRELYLLCAPIVLYQLLDAPPATRYPLYLFDMDPRYASALGIDLDRDIAAILAKRPALVIVGDYDSCGEIPEASWRKLVEALPRNGYSAAGRYGPYTFFTPRNQPRTAVTR
jgi:hypothetical protein